MPFDFKKEYKEFYIPKTKPSIIDVPAMNFVSVRGKGDPNSEDGEYRKALDILYGVSYTIKMSKKGDRRIEGYFDYVVPPLEGLWQQEDIDGIDYTRKDKFEWVSMIRLPDFVTESDFDWAVREASAKKKSDFSKAEFFTYTEGLCVQCMHIGSYDDEPETVEAMHRFISENGYSVDITEKRIHHEIYLSDPRKTDPGQLKTVIRLPVKK
ncbi:MAG: GyrI-like domain-containing protein [Ruminiclostridium sp.]|nr:GyrI-like domain-containing protein [Ruminiclostridium sp.]